MKKSLLTFALVAMAAKAGAADCNPQSAQDGHSPVPGSEKFDRFSSFQSV